MNIVYDNECLKYIDKPIAFVSHALNAFGAESIQTSGVNALNLIQREDGRDKINTGTHCRHNTTVEKWEHNTSKRKIGLIRKRYDDGGLEVSILSDDTINYSSSGNMKWTATRFAFSQGSTYSLQPLEGGYTRDHQPTVYPINAQAGVTIVDNGIPQYALFRNDANYGLDFDATLNYNPDDNWINGGTFTILWNKNHQYPTGNEHVLTDNKDTTLTFGAGIEYPDSVDYPKIYMDDPLKIFAGNFYQYACDQAGDVSSRFPTKISSELFAFYNAIWKMVDVKSTNLTAIPFNLILTNDETQAKKYLRDGTLPTDAFLYPLDFENLPQYSSDENDDEDEDDDDDDVNGDERDVDENLPEIPSYTAGSLNNNNVYLLLPGELNDIIDWFWNDVGDVNDFQDLMTKIEGLANNLAQNFLMFRIMPVNPNWIGGVGADNNFVVGGIEKAGDYKTLGKAPATIEDIGHWHFSDKFTSYKFLNYEPYSDFKLYLPYHGIVDIDVGIYQGHDLYVKAVYDYLSGTITYMLYCDNTWLTNTFTAKMCVDLNISLQSKNERDNAIYSNVSSTVAGLMGAGSTLATGNPMGLAVGANALVKQGSSAPYKVMASAGEDGAFYTPQKCAILVRRPRIRQPDTYKQHIGKQTFGSYTLAQLKGKGFTTVINPKLTFTETQPLQEEIDEINDLLSSGVYL